MFSNIYTWIFGEIKSLEKVLKPFSSMWSELENFIARADELIQIKNAAIANLTAQVNSHSNDQAQAQAIQAQISALLNKGNTPSA